ncbi:MAG: CDP-alcohol phosphatidyltransferase family protein [Spirochaetales bacterium]|nr:CDP-alcohol phosphatidyltransferase family protein [Spirochaetales bacterium]
MIIKLKSIPNIISISRIILSLLLLCLFKNPVMFVVIYLLAGLSDILDGFIARRYRLESDLGARLDSLGDLVFYIILGVYLVIEQRDLLLFYLIPIAAVFITRILSLILGLARHKKLTLIHTIANKTAGLLIFMLPIMLILKQNYFLALAIVIALLSSIEEMLIIILSPKGQINLNQKSIFRNCGHKNGSK